MGQATSQVEPTRGGSKTLSSLTPPLALLRGLASTMQHPEGVPDDSDLDSNAPLLPTTARTDEERKDPSHARYRFAWAWAVLGTFAIGLLWLAFGQAYLDRREDEARKGDPGFPSRIGFEGPTPTVRVLLYAHKTTN